MNVFQADNVSTWQSHRVYTVSVWLSNLGYRGPIRQTGQGYNETGWLFISREFADQSNIVSDKQPC